MKIRFAILSINQGKRLAIAAADRAGLEQSLKQRGFLPADITLVGEYDTDDGSIKRTHPDAFEDSYIRRLISPEVKRLKETTKLHEFA
jgi:hypothetical protein